MLYTSQSEMLVRDRMRARLAEADHERVARLAKGAASGHDRPSPWGALAGSAVRLAGRATSVTSALHRRPEGTA